MEHQDGGVIHRDIQHASAISQLVARRVFDQQGYEGANPAVGKALVGPLDRLFYVLSREIDEDGAEVCGYGVDRDRVSRVVHTGGCGSAAMRSNCWVRSLPYRTFPPPRPKVRHSSG